MFEDRDLDIPKFNADKHFPEFPDMLGNIVKPGDICVFGITAGRSSSLTIGLVKKFEKYDGNGNKIWENGFTEGAPSPYMYTSTHTQSCRVVFMALFDSINRYSRETTRHSSTSPFKMLKTSYTISDVEQLIKESEFLWDVDERPNANVKTYLKVKTLKEHSHD